MTRGNLVDDPVRGASRLCITVVLTLGDRLSIAKLVMGAYVLRSVSQLSSVEGQDDAPMLRYTRQAGRE